MSYCRWSCDDFRSDVYCYADVSGGYTTHVAENHRTGTLPPDPFFDFVQEKITSEEYTKRYKERMDELSKLPVEKIGLQHDGESFNDETLEQLKERLLHLRSVGYHVPEHALARIDEEIAEQANEAYDT